MKKYNQFILEYLYSSQQLIVGRVYLDGKNSRYKSNQEHYILYFGDVGSMEANGRHLLYMNLEKNDFQFRLWGKVVEDLEDTNLTIEEYLIKNWKEQDGANYYLLKDTSNRDGSFDANDFYKDTVVNEYGIPVFITYYIIEDKLITKQDYRKLKLNKICQGI